MKKTTDEQLIDKFQFLGDIESLNILVNRYLKKTYSFFLCQINNREDIEDLVQNVFLKIIRKINTGEQIRNFRHYLFTCCQHTFRDYLRQKKNSGLFQPVESADGTDLVDLIQLLKWYSSKNERHLSESEIEQVIDECISSFPDKKVQQILNDRISGYSLKEISQRNNCPTGSAGSIWFRHKSNLMRCVLKKLSE